MAVDSGWKDLFREAFTRSKNPMVLLDGQRRHVEGNGAYAQLLGYAPRELAGRHVYDFVDGGPLMTESEWRTFLHQDRFEGNAVLLAADGSKVTVEFAGHPAIVTGHQLVLVVVLRSNQGIRLRREGGEGGGNQTLTPRELEVVGLVAHGLTAREIASELHVAAHTVNAHVRNAMGKLEVRSRAQLVARVLGEGIWPPAAVG